MNLRLDPWLDLADAAGGALGQMPNGPARDALRAALVAAWQELYRVTSFSFDPNAQTVGLASRAAAELAGLGVQL